MIGKNDSPAKTGKLMVTIAAVAVDPTGLAATGAGLDALLHWHDTLAKRHPDIAKLAAETQKSFDKALRTPRFDKPADARQLLPQMLEIALPSGTAFVDHGLNPAPILDDMLARLTDPDHTRPEITAAFRSLYRPLLEQVCNDPRLKQALDPALTRDRIAREHRREGKIDEILTRLGGLEGAVADPNAASFEDLIALASQFEETDFATKAQVADFLTQKAEEYRSYKSTIDAIDERTKGLGNLKAAAQGAADALNFEQVETLLSRVHEVEIEIAAETAELRAQNALLRGRVDQAYTLLSTAADSFAIINPVEPARRRIGYEDQLYTHGLRYGSRGMALSEQMLRDAIAALNPEEHGQLWAIAQNALAIALQQQGIRTSGAAGTDLLAQSVAAYGKALTIYTKVDHPVDWAMTQNNLAAALRNQGSRTSGAPGTKLLAQAVTAYGKALTIRTQAEHPLDWAMTQNNLANALSEQGTRTSGPAGTKLLAQAVTAYGKALTIRTLADHPVHWAGTQNNLAIALQQQGIRTSGAAGTKLLAQSVTAYGKALTIRTQVDHPVDWAMTQENLAIAEQAIADHPATTDATPHLRRALDHVNAALTVYDPEHMSYDHETATTLRDKIRARLSNP